MSEEYRKDDPDKVGVGEMFFYSSSGALSDLDMKHLFHRRSENLTLCLSHQDKECLRLKNGEPRFSDPDGKVFVLQ